MKEVKKIIIKTESGHVISTAAYSDQLSISEKGMTYTYNPLFPTEEHVKLEWSFEVDNSEYKQYFAELGREIEIICGNNYPEAYDLGSVEFTIVYSDKTRLYKHFLLHGSVFSEVLSLVKKMRNSMFLRGIWEE